MSLLPSKTLKIFFSYCHRDEVLRSKLDKSLSALKRNQIIVSWHDRKIAAGNEFDAAIKKNLETADIILLLISNDFLASDYCYLTEMKLAMDRHEQGLARVIPILLHDCDWKDTPFSKLNCLPTDAKPITSWSNQNKAFADVARGVRAAVEQMLSQQDFFSNRSLHNGTPQRHLLPPIWNILHHRNPNFSGRDELLMQLQADLASGRPAALTQAFQGLGGVGKTQVALEYAYRNAEDYKVIWWVRSEEPTTLNSDFAALAENLGLDLAPNTSSETVREAVRQALARRNDWLLIFDNANNPEEIKDYIPQYGGHTLITSRHSDWHCAAHAVSIPVWTVEESTLFLKSRTGKEGSQAIELATVLGGLPLALEQAAAYINACGESIPGYLELFRERQMELFDQAYSPAPSDYHATVRTTWEVSFRRLQENTLAVQLLQLCAFFAPDDIPKDLLLSWEPVPDKLNFNSAVAALRIYSLVEVSEEFLSVHRLVQAVTRDRMEAQKRVEFAKNAIRLINEAFPRNISHEVEGWPLCAQLLSHVLTVDEIAERSGIMSPNLASLLNQAGIYLEIRADFLGAIDAFERAIKIGKVILSPNSPSLGYYYGHLGNVLWASGDLKRAKKVSEQALEIIEANYGPIHSSTATAVNNLGNILRSLGDLVGAKKEFERALKIMESRYSWDHGGLAPCYNSLGSVLHSLGEFPEAMIAFEQAVYNGLKAYGSDHPLLAEFLTNLGSILQELGDLQGAIYNYKHALRMFQEYLGNDHPKSRLVREFLDNIFEAIRRHEEGLDI
jgi:tetratricopeptide (TPR) repeat protein